MRYLVKNLTRKTFFLVLLSVIFILSVGFAKKTQAAVFGRDLRLGDNGSDVRFLQMVLNSDSETAVAKSGVGSFGSETDFFGLRTKQAVIKFQEKYRGEVLSPAGLFRGTGFVGSRTRAKLEKFYEEFVSNGPKSGKAQSASLPSGANANVSSANSIIGTPAGQFTDVSEIKSKISQSLNPSNPNFENAEYLLSAVRSVGREQGYTNEKLNELESHVITSLATTTNLWAKFEEEITNGRSSLNTGNSSESYIGKLFSFVTGKMKNIFGKTLPTAYAQGGAGQPFGGMILFPFFCTCSGNWLMTMMPFAPAYVVLLTHYTGAQTYLNYNVPFSRWVIGKYQSGGGNCQIYVVFGCITIPSQGQTTPFLGSSSF